MGTVAEWLVGRVTAAAERDHRPAGEPEWSSSWIDDLKFPFDTNGAVMIAGDFGGHQNILAANAREWTRISWGQFASIRPWGVGS